MQTPDENVKDLLKNIKDTCDRNEKCDTCPFKVSTVRGCIFGILPWAWDDEDID